MARQTIFTAADGSREKICAMCSERKPISSFNKNGNTVQSHCKPCRGIYRSQRRKMFPGKARMTDRKRALSRYGLTQDDWDTLFAKQGNVCAICSTAEPVNNNWHTDHDHKTGVVRGILCHHCNIALGYYEKVIQMREESFKKYLALTWRD